ncbi:hypothetical protein CRUP_030328 [Coryphaenoides rupestris]|nr:hypothetical protein CRUP_030328 [Coryphaenoides rupestris]
MEDALLRNLFLGYQRWVRPVQRANDTVRVRFGLKISQLVDVRARRDETLLLLEAAAACLLDPKWSRK